MPKHDLAKAVADLLEVEARYEARSGDTPDSQPGKPASAKAIAAAEKMHGKLRSYRKFLALHDGWKNFPWGMHLYSTAQLTGAYDRGYLEEMIEEAEDDENDDAAEVSEELKTSVTIGVSDNDGSLILLLQSGEVVEWLYEITSRHIDFEAFLMARANVFRSLLATEARHEKQVTREWTAKHRAASEATLAKDVRAVLAKAPRTTPVKIPVPRGKRPKAARASTLIEKKGREVVAEVTLNLVLYLGNAPTKEETAAAYRAWRRRFASKQKVEWMFADEYFTHTAESPRDDSFLDRLRVQGGHYGIRAQADTRRDGRTGRYVFNLRRVPPEGRSPRAGFCEVIVPASESADALAELAAELLAILPVRSGRAGYCAYAWDSDAETETDRAIYGWCRRFWGVDVGTIDGWLPGTLTRIQGASWLTILGPTFATELARAKRLAFTKPITVTTTDRGAIIRCGALPSLVDVARGDPAPVAQVEHALAPLAVHLYNHRGWMSFGSTVFSTETDELGPFHAHRATRTWVHRFLDPAAFLAPSVGERAEALLKELAKNLDDDDREELDDEDRGFDETMRLLYNAANEPAGASGVAALELIASQDCDQQGIAASQLLYLYLQDKKWKPALAFMDHALALARREPGILHNAACIFARAGKPDRALACVIEAKKLRYKNMAKLLDDDDLVSLHGMAGWKRLLKAAT